MTRQGHKLSRLTRNVMPEHIIFVDTETTQELRPDNRLYHKLKLGVAIHARFRRDGKKDSKEVYRFIDNIQFWEYVTSKSLSKTVLYLVSHNAVFDFTVLQHIKHLRHLGYKIQFVYEGGMTFISKWRKNGHTIIILDNANWFAGKLERWGQELDLPKLVMPEKGNNQEQWFTYCERDTEILYQMSKWYFKFLRDNDLGSWRYTIASSAFTAFRHRFMNHPIYIPDENDDSELARKSYHGGRTECFRVGKYNFGQYYYLDINSMYPYVMREYEYPTCFEGQYFKPDIDKLYRASKKKTLIAECLINTPIPYFIYRRNDRNIYPTGEFTTTLTTEEFKLAYDNEWIKEVGNVCIYRSRKLFGDYVDFFHGVKKQAGSENKRLVRAFAKLYLNCLYGKFGQRGYIDRIIGEDSKDTFRVSYGYNARTKQRYTLRQIGHRVIYSEKGGEGYNSFCAIASHVTANARLYLYSSILRVGRENCFYCDTDSMIVNQTGFNRIKLLLSKERLGFWKLESIAESIEIVAPKHYHFGDKIVMKGVRKDAEKLGENTYKQEIWPGFNTILRHGQEEYFNIFQVKILSPDIQSGMVQGDGTITPFVL